MQKKKKITKCSWQKIPTKLEKTEIGKCKMYFAVTRNHDKELPGFQTLAVLGLEQIKGSRTDYLVPYQIKVQNYKNRESQLIWKLTLTPSPLKGFLLRSILKEINRHFCVQIKLPFDGRKKIVLERFQFLSTNSLTLTNGQFITETMNSNLTFAENFHCICLISMPAQENWLL